jgi:ferredoxin
MNLRVDRTKCCGNGICEVTAPTVYVVGDDGQAHVLKDEPSSEEMPVVEDAIASCPTGALSIGS